MPLYDSGQPVANVALSDTFNSWRIVTNQINTQAAGLSSNNIWTGANNTFNSVINAAKVVANTFVGDGSGLTGLSAGLDWSATTTNGDYYVFLVSNTSGSGTDQFEVGAGISFNPSSNTLSITRGALNVGNASITVTSSAAKFGIDTGNKIELASDGTVTGAVSSYANTTSNTASSNSEVLITKGGLLNFVQDSATISSSAPTNVGPTSNGHVWYIY